MAYESNYFRVLLVVDVDISRCDVQVSTSYVAKTLHAVLSYFRPKREDVQRQLDLPRTLLAYACKREGNARSTFEIKGHYI